MCPHVMWDKHQRLWKMWYSGGEQYEPNAIGYATSGDGLRWEKYAKNPVLTPAPGDEWEKERVTAAQIIVWKGWYYAFYIGFRDVDHAQIGLARSKDGIGNWVRHPANPIVRPKPEWDADACYKPFAIFADGRWMLWYNGRNKAFERLALSRTRVKISGSPGYDAIPSVGRSRLGLAALVLGLLVLFQSHSAGRVREISSESVLDRRAFVIIL